MKPPASSSQLATADLKNPTISIPLDVLLKILVLLSTETLFKCRYVSKSWMQLIDHHFLKSSLPSTVAGFFYHNYKGMTIYAAKSNNDIYSIDSTFSFLPFRRDFEIDSCRNGLILCSALLRPQHYDEQNRRVGKERACFVCNPATKSWLMLPKLVDAKPVLLDFNPHSSPHYRVFSIDNNNNCWIYTSRTRRWTLQDQGAFRAAFLWQSRLKHMVTFWKGAAYSITLGGGGYYWLTQGYKLLTRFPEEIRVQDEICFDEFQDLGLCLARFYGFQLTVWSHGGGARDVWVIQHKSNVEGLQHQKGQEDARQCLAFHPFMKAVFILYDRVIYVYHLDGMALKEFCRLESGMMVHSAFPFLPCLLDVIGDGMDAEGHNVKRCQAFKEEADREEGASKKQRRS